MTTLPKFELLYYIYIVGKPMFGKPDTNADDSAAVREAIKIFDSVGALDIDEANTAFDMDFDEVALISD